MIYYPKEGMVLFEPSLYITHNNICNGLLYVIQALLQRSTLEIVVDSDNGPIFKIIMY